MHLRYCTLTGAGLNTSLDAMFSLSTWYPFLEWAVLYSPDRAGQENRYPTVDWLTAFADFSEKHQMNVALHVCGKAVDRLLDDEDPALLELAGRFGRVQLNARAKMAEVGKWKRLVSNIHRGTGTQVILQWFPSNEEMCLALGGENGFEVLVDRSGGRGIEPTEWPTREAVVHHFGHPLGYAGGLGPHNIEAQLSLISAAALRHGRAAPFSIDMEGRVRNEHDELDLDKCAQVLSSVQRVVVRERAEEGLALGAGTIEVADLSGHWLDFWVAQALGFEPAIPPADAVSAVLLNRRTGKFENYRPSQDTHEMVRLLGDQLIAVTPTPDPDHPGRCVWFAHCTRGGPPPVRGSTLMEAGLRAIVSKYFGPRVPRNPTDI